jgi:ERCC4-type nuclease
MLTVDNRRGFGKGGPAGFIELLGRCGLSTQLGRMPFGDIRFLGSGPEGMPVTVGIEVKSIHDILHCITDGRFAGHQLPGMMATYEQPWLLVQGQWRARRQDGLLQYLSPSYQWRDAHVGSRKFMYRDLMAWMLTVRTKVGIEVEYVADWEHAAIWIASLYAWWTRGKRMAGEDKVGWDTHTSHQAVNQASNEQFWSRVKQDEREARNGGGTRNGGGNGDTSNLAPRGLRGRLADPAHLLRPTVCRMVAAQLPGIGYARSEQVAKRFPSVASLVAATERELCEIEGVGKLGAKKVWRALHS